MNMNPKAHDWITTRMSLLDRLSATAHNTTWQDSWKEFFDTYWKLIYGVARKWTLSDTEAQDVVQEVMAHVAKLMPTFKYNPSLGSFKAWLLVKTRWCIITQLRRRKAPDHAALESPTDSHSPAVDPPDPAGEDLEKEWDLQWKENLLETGLHRLRNRMNPLHLQIFDFYVRKEIAAEEVASKFGVSVDQVYVIKHRVTTELTKEIERLEREVT